MRQALRFPAAACLPDAGELLQEVGPSGASASFVAPALALLGRLAEPAGLFAEVGAEQFAPVFAGSGENDPRAPLGGIYRRAERLALFAVTLGPGPNAEIARLFEARDYPLGYLLDAAASAATERLADLVAEECGRALCGTAGPSPGALLLPYSPGYCGWHVGAQRPLFAALRPGEIGIALRESCLMEPLKSISGVLVLGPAQIHRFDDDFDFCSACLTRACRERMGRLDGAATAKE